MLRRLLPALVFAASVLPVAAQTGPPKREMRGAWIATVGSLDWPNSGQSAADQKSNLVYQLDQLKGLGINVVIFQVRPEADALYRSDIEPWSRWLTGTQGQDPGYDPLAFVIHEAHVRGMELHAWFNPYRVEQVTGRYPLAANNVAVQHPEWMLSFPAVSLRMLNPGLEGARNHSVRVVADVVRRYDVDGIHFDDYFYPYPNSGKGFSGITNEDAASYNAYTSAGGQLGLGDWRRENVHKFVKQVRDSIDAIRPSVKYGISPFGIWRPGTPSGINGLDAYGSIYCDALPWLRGQWLDYLTPQLYWGFGGGQDYAKLAPWWKAQMNGRDYYPGLITSTDRTRIPAQIRYNRDNAIPGYVLFRSNTVWSNTSGVADSLRQRQNIRPALPPSMAWQGDDLAPNAPVLNTPTSSGSRITVSWTKPVAAVDGDTARFYAIYRFPAGITPDVSTSEYLVNVQGGGRSTYVDAPPAALGTSFTYVVTALDENWNESAMSIPAVGTGAEGSPDAVQKTSLDRVGPNPVGQGEAVRIGYTVAAAGRVTLEVYDVLGRRVAEVVDAVQAAGPHEAMWDAAGVAPGTYVVRMQAGGALSSRAFAVR